MTQSNEDLPIADFSGTTFGDWKVTGTAFQRGPATEGVAANLGLRSTGGHGVATSKIEGDQPIGTLTSPPFKIQRKYISFLISGGDYEYVTCLNLVINGKIVKSATGRNSDQMLSESWDVSRFHGKTAEIQIVDDATGDWGHIDVAQLVQTDQPKQLPVVTEPLYKESLRPQFHFTARQWTMDRLEPGQYKEGWINDLNGLIYYDGEYHLFAQRWAKCWLHAVSKDLIHWTELEPAFWEEWLGSGVQSGTCVVDYKNTSGLAQDPKHPALIAFWPRFDNRSQCICYSFDHGRTWTRYAKNPILIHPERDPKVFWYAPGKHWVMMLYGDGSYHVLTSNNLLDWKDEHHPIHDSYECPDFFELALDGDHSKMKWVLIQGNGNFSVGTFNGTEFTEETKRFPCDIGPHFYATQSWANVETGDGRRIQTAWMRAPSFPGMPFNQQISFPCLLTLHSTPDGPRVYREPIKEIALLHESSKTWKNHTLKPGTSLELAREGNQLHLKAEVQIPDGATLTFDIGGEHVDLTRHTIHSGDAHATISGPIQTIEILVDRGSIEVYLNHGEVSSTRFALPKPTGLSVSAQGGDIEFNNLAVFKLKSAWRNLPH